MCRSRKEAPLDDLNSAAWQPVKDLLASLSASRAVQGFTPSETATFVLSLKAPIFDLIRKQSGSDTDLMFTRPLNRWMISSTSSHFTLRTARSWTR